jgi:hypothetical protein
MNAKVNIVALTQLTKLLLPPMVARGRERASLGQANAAFYCRAGIPARRGRSD